MTDSTNGGYDEFLDELADGDGYFYACSNGHGLLPPRQVCPHCGDRELARRELPRTGEIVTHTTVSVPTPQFDDDAPTSLLSSTSDRYGSRGSSEESTVTTSRSNSASLRPLNLSETTDDRTITFRPAQ